MSLTDMEKLGKLGKARNIITVFDNTFASPYHQNPILDFGIGIQMLLAIELFLRTPYMRNFVSARFIFIELLQT